MALRKVVLAQLGGAQARARDALENAAASLTLVPGSSSHSFFFFFSVKFFFSLFCLLFLLRVSSHSLSFSLFFFVLLCFFFFFFFFFFSLCACLLRPSPPHLTVSSLVFHSLARERRPVKVEDKKKKKKKKKVERKKAAQRLSAPLMMFGRETALSLRSDRAPPTFEIGCQRKKKKAELGGLFSLSGNFSLGRNKVILVVRGAHSVFGFFFFFRFFQIGPSSLVVRSFLALRCSINSRRTTLIFHFLQEWLTISSRKWDATALQLKVSFLLHSLLSFSFIAFFSFLFFFFFFFFSPFSRSCGCCECPCSCSGFLCPSLLVLLLATLSSCR